MNSKADIIGSIHGIDRGETGPFTEADARI